MEFNFDLSELKLRLYYAILANLAIIFITNSDKNHSSMLMLLLFANIACIVICIISIIKITKKRNSLYIEIIDNKLKIFKIYSSKSQIINIDDIKHIIIKSNKVTLSTHHYKNITIDKSFIKKSELHNFNKYIAKLKLEQC